MNCGNYIRHNADKTRFAGFRLPPVYEDYYADLPEGCDLDSRLLDFLLGFSGMPEYWRDTFVKSFPTQQERDDALEFVQTVSHVYLYHTDWRKNSPWMGVFYICEGNPEVSVDEKTKTVTAKWNDMTVTLPDKGSENPKPSWWTPWRIGFVAALSLILAASAAIILLSGNKELEEPALAPIVLDVEDRLTDDGWLGLYPDSTLEMVYCEFPLNESADLSHWPAHARPITDSVYIWPENDSRIVVYARDAAGDSTRFTASEYVFDLRRFAEAALITDKRHIVDMLMPNSLMNPLTVDYGGGIVERRSEINMDVLASRIRNDLYIDSIATGTDYSLSNFLTGHRSHYPIIKHLWLKSR